MKPPNFENPYADVGNEELRADLWARTIQMSLAEDLPVDLPIRDLLACALNTALNEVARLRNAHSKVSKDYKNSDDTVKALRNALADMNDTRQTQMLRLIEMLKLIVETPVTHGQKNGMILLIAEIAQRMSHHDLYMGDIPF